MNISVCITTLNEEKTIGPLLDSLLNQTKKPEEIVIVDGGSKDKTPDIIRHFQKKDKRIKLLIEKGGIAHGKNTAVDLAKNEIIAQIDAGCIARKDWLQKITEPLVHTSIDFVAGFYEMTGESFLQKAVALYQGIPPERYKITSFIPSGRSMAFKKRVWEEVGGYRENLDRGGDDTEFCYKVIKGGYRIVRIKDAIVYWEAPKSLKEAAKKFFLHARGDAQAKIWWNPSQRFSSHNLKISSIFIRYTFFFSLLILGFFAKIPLLVFFVIFGLYLIWSIWKWRDVKRGWKALLWLPILQISSDIAVMLGFIYGTIGR